VRHTRHYTLAEANAARPWVAERVRRIRAGQEELVALGERAVEALATLDPRTGGAYPGREVARSLVAVSRAADELQAVEVVLRDAGRGLVDFPAVRDGEEVYLCWLLEEDEVRFWHAPEAGFGGRRPL